MHAISTFLAMKLGTQVESSYTAARKLKGGQKHDELTILYRTVHNAYQSFLIKQTNKLHVPCLCSCPTNVSFTLLSFACALLPSFAI